MPKVLMISLGCAKNLIDSEQMLSLLDKAGYEITDDPEEADFAVINTCAFIESAQSEAIENILKVAAYKETGKLKKLVVAGCLAQRYKSELLEEMPEVDAVIGTASADKVVEAIEGEKKEFFADINAPISEDERIVSTGPSWGYIKVAEGCSHNCAYCVIPSLRGRYRSRPMEKIVAEAKEMAENGVRELIIVAQDPTLYGVDLYKKKMLPELVHELCKIEKIHWIRLHYLYPDAVDDAMIDCIVSEPKVLRYLDIPIQHINNAILKKMRRRGTGDDIRALFKKLRERIPGLVLRTSIITGLPGEGEAEFEELCTFLREAKIERAGVFAFSPEEGTDAAKMEHVSTEEANDRAIIVNDLQARIMDEFNASRVNTETEILCEGYDEEMNMWFGRSFAESPDVDGVIWFSGEDIAAGEFYNIVIRGELDGELVGEKL
ncbi:MAG: 30S ribosomal protein S12 methylthiotransferase RimO [Oscillospiraceae bacterium]|nr:30S ribosomal protein S12 methylthiotransferase RimO [Oscillospiraceae bacterium]